MTPFLLPSIALVHIVGIVDSAGNEVVKYIYDSWGKILSTSGSLASTLGTIQPFRYRGYVYDEETGLYYLRSRYYDPRRSRFLNTDTVLGEIGRFNTRNTFAYCTNNTPNCHDSNGTIEWLCCYYEPFDDPLNINRAFGCGMMTAYWGNASSGPHGNQYTTDAMATNPRITTVIGGGHGNTIHNEAINTMISELSVTLNYETIYGNRSLYTAGLNGRWRPDITAIAWNGSSECWEVASPSQAIGTTGYTNLQEKITLMQQANPNTVFHTIITWEEIAK